MNITIIYPTKNRSKELIKSLNITIKQLKKINISYEILIIDQSSEQSDITEIKNYIMKLKQIKIIHVLDSTIKGLTHAKNIGLKLAKGEIIFFLEDDVFPCSDYYDKILDTYNNNNEIFAIGGIITNYKSKIIDKLFFKVFRKGNFKDLRREIYWNYTHYSGIIEVNVLSGGVSSIRKIVGSEFKFDENLIKYSFLEDFDFYSRVAQKYKLYIHVGAKVVHEKSINNRHDIKIETENKIVAYSYFYKFKLKHNLYNWYYFQLLKLGIFLQAAFISINKFTIKPINGFFSGIKIVRNNFKESKILDIK